VPYNFSCLLSLPFSQVEGTAVLKSYSYCMTISNWTPPFNIDSICFIFTRTLVTYARTIFKARCCLNFQSTWASLPFVLNRSLLFTELLSPFLLSSSPFSLNWSLLLY
jgi:hypothetical protein